MSTRDRKGRRPRQDNRKEFSRTSYNDPPPRFANRRNLHENYDSNKFSNNYGSSNHGGGESGFSPRKERDRQINNYGTRSYSNKMYGNGTCELVKSISWYFILIVYKLQTTSCLSCSLNWRTRAWSGAAGQHSKCWVTWNKQITKRYWAVVKSS